MGSRLAKLALPLLCAASAAAQDIRVSASVSKRRSTMEDQLVLSVTLTGSGSISAAPKLPPLPDFEAYESGRAQNYSIVNGRMSSAITYTYVLAPRRPGKFTIGPIEVAGAGSTQPFEVEIVPTGAAATGPPPAEPARPAEPPARGVQEGRKPPVFVTATLDKARAFVNEQVTLTVRFYTAVPLLGQPQYQAPKLTGLMAEELGGEGGGRDIVGGVPYQFSEMRSALFPVQAGRATIGPATVAVQVPRGMGDDFFDRFFGMVAAETRRLTTDPLAVQVDALPPGRPDDFSDVVGRLELKAAADRTKVKAGEAVVYTLTVSGVGNVKAAPEPKRPELPSVRFFDMESSFAPAPAGGRVGGAKTFRMTLVPRVSGPLEIPGPTLSYFDPQKREYVRARAPSVRLDVQPGDPGAALPLVVGGTAAPGVTAVAEDIRYLKAPRGSARAGDAIAAFGASGPWHALPFAALILAAGREWRRRAHERDPRARRRREARSAAERRLKEALALPETERARAAALLADSLTGYLADTLDLPPAGITLKRALDGLAAERRPPSADTLARLQESWRELELLRFAPGAAGHAETERLAARNRELFAALERELKS